MNRLFFFLILLSYLWAVFHSMTGPDIAAPMQALTQGMLEAAANAVTLSFSLIGAMAFFLGLMKIAESAGLLVLLGRLLRPILIRLFPEIPRDHPAMGAMIMNLAANMLGLGNAATPFGLKAMQHLDSLNTQKGVATNAMVLFLAINTSSVTLIPTSIIALRQASGSVDPAGIIPTTLFATIFSTIAAIIAAKCLQRFWKNTESSSVKTAAVDKTSTPIQRFRGDQPKKLRTDILTWLFGFALAAILLYSLIRFGEKLSPWLLPSLVCMLMSYGVYKGVKLYDCFVEGAKEGFDVTIRIMPYLIAILVAIKLLTVSGILPAIVSVLSPLTIPLGLPADALPTVLLRPLSGSGSYGAVAAIFENPQFGPDSVLGYLVSTIQGSTETTFYVLAVYFGSVQIRKIRHALAVGLLADAVAVFASVWIVNYLHG